MGLFPSAPDHLVNMGISRDSWHKRRSTGGRMVSIRMKRQFEMGRPSNTKIAPVKRVHIVRTRGGNKKFRALRLDSGNFSWGSESVTRKARIIKVVYNSTRNEIVRTNTLVKNTIIQIDATPFKQWFENHYVQALGRKKTTKIAEDEDPLLKKRSKSVTAKVAARKPSEKMDQLLEDQFRSNRLYACISSRPGQSGRADGYILEGAELAFYLKKMNKKNKD